MIQPYLKPGATLQGGKYRIVRVLGQGGFGITYLAAHTSLDKQVAIKEFFPKSYCDRDESTSRVTLTTRNNEELAAKFKEKFKKEARNISRFDHPGIVRVHDVFDENGTAYYVMDYISGGSLDDYIVRNGGIGEAECLALTRRIGSALAFMHANRMLHLDLKPSNIMRRENSEPVLIDFGLSKLYDDGGNPETSMSVGRGTLGYAPTEQADYRDGQGFPVTMDVYALGATLFKLLTGTPPPAPSVILNNGFPEKELIARGVGAATRAIIIRAMSPRQADRYQSVEEMLAAVDGVVIEDGDVVPDETEDITVVEIEEPVPPQKKKEKKKEDTSVVSDNTGSTKNVPSNRKRRVWYSILSVVGILIATWAACMFLRFSPASGPHEAVDLGLSVKWATCNVGAASPSDYGDYFAWGETGKKLWYLDSNSDTYGECYGNIGGNSSMDVARANWGGTWRLPTHSELEELVNNCSWKWTTMNGKSGYKVTGRNGNSIFLPAAGWRYGSSLYYAGSDGDYWSSTPNESYTSGAYDLDFNSGNHSVDWSSRGDGRSVRPVSE